MAHGRDGAEDASAEGVFFSIYGREATVSEAWLSGSKPKGAGAFVLLKEASDAKALKDGHTLSKGGHR